MATKEEVLNTLLSLVDDKYDKRVGSFIYDALSPVAEKLATIDTSIEDVKNKMVIDNLSGDELTQRVKERTGIERKLAEYATGIVTLTGSGTIKINDLFETSRGIRFRSIETKQIVNSGDVLIECLEVGTIGNVDSNTITMFPTTIAGFTAVTNNEPTTGGTEEETDSDLLQRYYAYIRNPSTSGNVAAYKNWALSVNGVGGVKVEAGWNGALSVKLTIIDSNKEPATQDIIDEVKTYIDASNNGIGEGVAPIGTVLTVESAVAKTIDISVSIELLNGYDIVDVQAAIEANLQEYLKSIAFMTDSISFAKIGSTILNADGVNDYQSLLVNGDSLNVTIANNEVAVLGTVTINP